MTASRACLHPHAPGDARRATHRRRPRIIAATTRTNSSITPDRRIRRRRRAFRSAVRGSPCSSSAPAPVRTTSRTVGAKRGQSHHDGNLLVSPARVLSLARLRSSRQHGLFACHGAGDSCVLVDMQSALHGAESIGALRTFAVATCAGTGLTIPECHCRVCTQALYRAHRGPRPVSSLPMDSALVVPSTPTRAPLCSRRGRARSATQSASAPDSVRR
jgi:hypothetical protein